MNLCAPSLVILNIVLHLWFLIFEMFLWQKPFTLKAFKMSPQLAKDSAVLAANQGLYNGFLAAGLIWSFFISDPAHAREVQLFFLGCMSVAGVYGACTANRRIFFMQAMPALVGFASVFW